jgi:hypothetical protein
VPCIICDFSVVARRVVSITTTSTSFTEFLRLRNRSLFDAMPPQSEELYNAIPPYPQKRARRASSEDAQAASVKRQRLGDGDAFF